MDNRICLQAESEHLPRKISRPRDCCVLTFEDRKDGSSSMVKEIIKVKAKEFRHPFKCVFAALRNFHESLHKQFLMFSELDYPCSQNRGCFILTQQVPRMMQPTHYVVDTRTGATLHPPFKIKKFLGNYNLLQIVKYLHISHGARAMSRTVLLLYSSALMTGPRSLVTKRIIPIDRTV